MVYCGELLCLYTITIVRLTISNFTLVDFSMSTAKCGISWISIWTAYHHPRGDNRPLQSVYMVVFLDAIHFKKITRALHTFHSALLVAGNGRLARSTKHLIKTPRLSMG